MKLKRLIVCFVFVCLTIVGLFIPGSPLIVHRLNLPSTKLPDGSLLKVAAICYGTNESYIEWDRPRWQVILGTNLPGKWAYKWGLLPYGAGVILESPPGKPGLMVATIQEGPSSLVLREQQGEFLDEAGNVFKSENFPNTGEFVDRKWRSRLSSWKLMDVPPKPKWLILKFSHLTEDGTNRVFVWHFKMRNPAYKGE